MTAGPVTLQYKGLQVSESNPLPVSSGSSSGITSVGGLSGRVATSFTRPADTVAYAVGDLIANSVSVGTIQPLVFPVARVTGGTGQIIRARMRKTGLSLTNASFRLHLLRVAPTPANGDNGVFSISGAADYLGSIDITMDQVFTDGATGIGATTTGPVMIFETVAASTSLYGLIEARGAYAPVSGETFGVLLEVVRD